jgi:hypothetical protein
MVRNEQYVVAYLEVAEDSEKKRLSRDRFYELHLGNVRETNLEVVVTLHFVDNACLLQCLLSYGNFKQNRSLLPHSVTGKCHAVAPSGHSLL